MWDVPQGLPQGLPQGPGALQPSPGGPQVDRTSRPDPCAVGDPSRVWASSAGAVVWAEAHWRPAPGAGLVSSISNYPAELTGKRGRPVSNNDRGWSPYQLELIKVQLLDLAIENCTNSTIPLLSDYASDLTADNQLLMTAVKALVAEGLVAADERLGGIVGVVPTDRGEIVATQRRELRKDRKLRSKACREAILDWLYAQNHPVLTAFKADTRARYFGEPFSDDEIQSATRDLRDKGLVKGTVTANGWVPRPNITVDGKAVVEDFDSSISTYEGRSTPIGSTTVNIRGKNLNGVFTVGDNATITQNNGTFGSELTSLLTAIIEASRGTDEEDAVSRLVAKIQLEADDEEPDETVVTKAVERLESVATQATSDALVHAITQLAQWVHQHGVLQALGLG